MEDIPAIYFFEDRYLVVNIQYKNLIYIAYFKDNQYNTRI
jgi:hypothetical protein